MDFIEFLDTLRNVVRDQGKEVLDSPDRLVGILKDSGATDKKLLTEIRGALELGVHKDILNRKEKKSGRDVKRLAESLQDKYLWMEDTAREVVLMVFFGLGLLSHEVSPDSPKVEAVWGNRSIFVGDWASLGDIYISGTLVNMNYEIAAECYRKGDEEKNPYAQYRLGCCYILGDGVEQNDAIAVELYTKAADKELVMAQFRLGECYIQGRGVEKNEKKAVDLFEKAAAKGHAQAIWRLGVCYEYGSGVEKNEKKAVDLFKEAADTGEATLQFELGYCYEFGIGVEKNPDEAIDLYKKAGEQGEERALKSLTEYYASRKKPEEKEEAAYWYRKAAKKRIAQALYELGNSYSMGIGVEICGSGARKCFEAGAGENYAPAKYGLGICWLNGIGGDKNEEIAKNLIREAADEGCAEAMDLLEKKNWD